MRYRNLLLLFSQEAAIDPYGENLVVNGGFETAGTGGDDFFASWDEEKTDGAIASESTIIHGGSKAAKITAGATKNSNVYQDITVEAGKEYIFDAWIASDGLNIQTGRVTVYELPGFGVLLNEVGSSTTTAYAKGSWTVTVPAGCTSIRIYLLCSFVDTGIAYFDDVSLREIL